MTFLYEEKMTTLPQLAPNTPISSLPPILAADFGLPPSTPLAFHLNQRTLDPAFTLEAAAVKHQDVVEVTRAAVTANSSASGNGLESIPPQLWMQPALLHAHFQANPRLIPLLRNDAPLYAAVQSPSPQSLITLLNERISQRMAAQRREHERQARIAADPFGEEAQKEIEEEIRQKNIQENMASAIEWSPESFGHIVMLYVPMVVNGQPLQAFVDSGAQSTIMSRQCAERCGIMRLCDTRYAGIAKGVGTARILGRVHSVKVQIGGVTFLSSFTILDDGSMDFLFGLDQLRKHRACIDLEKNCLRLLGQEVQFLAEKDLPSEKRGTHAHEDESKSSSLSQSVPTPPRSPAPVSVVQRPPASAQSMLSGGGGQALRPPVNEPAVSISASPFASRHSAGSPSATAAHITASPSPVSSTFAAPPVTPSFATPVTAAGGGATAEGKVQTLVELGFSRSEALRALTMHNGNEELAAAFLFNQQYGM